MKNLTQLKQKDLKPLKQKLHNAQDNICPLLKIKVPLEQMVVDHKHKLKANPAGPNGDGLVRGAIEFRANALEGKISNNWKRYYSADESKHPITLSNYLRNLADFLENPPCEQIYIHPSEKPKVKKLGKRVFKKIAKMYSEEYPKRKELQYPKSCKPTKQIKLLAEHYDLEL
jgi:hypothetical protein